MDFTTFKDTALYTAEVAVDTKAIPEHFSVAGDTMDFNELVTANEEGSGKKLTVKQLGSLADLDAKIESTMQADPANVFAYLPLMYYRAMLNGKGFMPVRDVFFCMLMLVMLIMHKRQSDKGM